MPKINLSIKSVDAAYQQAATAILQSIKNNTLINSLLDDRGIKSLTIAFGTPGSNANGITNVLYRLENPLITLNNSLITDKDGELYRSVQDGKDENGDPIFIPLKTVKSIVIHEIIHALFPRLTSAKTEKFTVHEEVNPFPETGAVTDLVGEVAF